MGTSSFETCGLVWIWGQLAQLYVFSKKFWLLNYNHGGGRGGPQGQRGAKESGMMTIMHQGILTSKGRKGGHAKKKGQWTGNVPLAWRAQRRRTQVMHHKVGRLGKETGRRKRFWKWRGETTEKPQCPWMKYLNTEVTISSNGGRTKGGKEGRQLPKKRTEESGRCTR